MRITFETYSTFQVANDTSCVTVIDHMGGFNSHYNSLVFDRLHEQSADRKLFAWFIERANQTDNNSFSDAGAIYENCNQLLNQLHWSLSNSAASQKAEDILAIIQLRQ
jgi:Na+-transporting NADH:ubiquinone oxidoreductase subunit NqrF